jgi:hypothetical protein
MASCQLTRPELHTLLEKAKYGRDDVAFNCYFKPGSQAPLCNATGCPYGEIAQHPDKTSVAMKQVHLAQSMKAPGPVDSNDIAKLIEVVAIDEEVFKGWLVRQCKMYLMRDGKKERVIKYADVQDGCSYFLERPGDNFSGFAEVEAKVQTQDAVETIQNGIQGLNLFQAGKANVVFEPKFHPPKGTHRPSEKWDFPINPDALLVNESSKHWLLLEAKHDLTVAHVGEFLEKVAFLQAHKNSKWVCQKRTPPNNIIPAVCSISNPTAIMSKFVAHPDLKWLVRNGLRYRML